MNIALLSNSSEVGGGNRSLLLICEGLRELGHQVIVSIPQDGPMVEACIKADLNYEIMPYVQPSLRAPLRTIRSSWIWSDFLKEHKIDLVHANDPYTARAISLTCWRKNIPLICHVRFPVNGDSAQWMFRRLPKPAAFIFNSNSMIREHEGRLFNSTSQIMRSVVYNAVDVNIFKPQDNFNATFTVGILANLIPIKGHLDFLEMAILLKKRNINAEYWIIGEDIHQSGYRQELETFSTNHGLKDSVQFLGHRSDIPSLLTKLDVLVCPSHVEPFGRCLIEAMACERPVVATNVGGIPEIVDHETNGFLVEPHSPESLTEAVSLLYGNSDLRARMGENGRQKVIEYFSQESHIDNILGVYDKVL